MSEFGIQSSDSSNIQLFTFNRDYPIWFFFPHKVLEENGEQVPCYSVMVSLQEVGGAETKNWTVPRKLNEFQNLHRKLSEVLTLATGGKRYKLPKFVRMIKI